MIVRKSMLPNTILYNTILDKMAVSNQREG